MRRWRRRVVVLLLLVLVAATVRLFVLPRTDAPRDVDAVVVLGGQGDRLGEGLRLVRAGFAKQLVVSMPGQGCPTAGSLPGIQVRCFSPDPRTTQGEARYTAALVRSEGWHSVIVVSTTDQVTRARLRLRRCTGVTAGYVATPPANWPRAVAYEWGALVKALTLQRSC